MDLVDLAPNEREVLLDALDWWIDTAEEYLLNMPSDSKTWKQYQIALTLESILEREHLCQPEEKSLTKKSLTSLVGRLRSLWT